MSENRTLYKLYDESHYKECSEEDEWYEKIGSVKENKLFEDNHISTILYSKPMYADDQFFYTWNLYSEWIYFWNLTCSSKGDT